MLLLLTPSGLSSATHSLSPDGQESFCAVCEENNNNAITRCSHLFCYDCIVESVKTINEDCPMCRAPVVVGQIIKVGQHPDVEAEIRAEMAAEAQGEAEAEAEQSQSQAPAAPDSDSDLDSDAGHQLDVEKLDRALPWDDENRAALTKTAPRGWAHSAKIVWLVKYVLEMVRNNDTLRREGKMVEKVVIFSQWTSMLNLVEDALIENNVAMCRIDGQMSMDLRRRSLNYFEKRPRYVVMLASLKAAGQGINLTSANKCVLLDMWWVRGLVFPPSSCVVATDSSPAEPGRRGPGVRPHPPHRADAARRHCQAHDRRLGRGQAPPAPGEEAPNGRFCAQP